MSKSRPKEEQQGRIIPYEQFNLSNFKADDKGVNYTYTVNGTEAATIKVDGDRSPHPDLQEQLERLKPYVAKRMGFIEGWETWEERERSRDAKSKDLDIIAEVQDLRQREINLVKVNGFSYSGIDDGLGVKISGYKKVPKAGGFGFSTPKITFSQDKLEYEKEVAAICEDIKQEVYNYAFLGKKLQGDMFEDQEENNDEDQA